MLWILYILEGFGNMKLAQKRSSEAYKKTGKLVSGGFPKENKREEVKVFSAKQTKRSKCLRWPLYFKKVFRFAVKSDLISTFGLDIGSDATY